MVFPIEQTLGQSRADSLLNLLKNSRKSEKIVVKNVVHRTRLRMVDGNNYHNEKRLQESILQLQERL